MVLMSICSEQMMDKIYRLDFFTELNKNRLLSLVLTSPVARAAKHTLAKMRE